LGFVKVYSDKTMTSSVDLLKTKVLPAYRSFKIPLDKILNDNSKEYTTNWNINEHEYKAFLQQQNIRHIKIKLTTSRTNGFGDRLNKTLLEEFY